MSSLSNFREKFGLSDDGHKDLSGDWAFDVERPSGAIEKDHKGRHNNYKTGAIYSRKDHSYIGSISKEDGLNNKKLEEVFRKYADEDNGYNSHNDVAFAVQMAHEHGIDVSNDDIPIEHSQEVQDAKARSEEFIRKATDGTTARSIFGASNDLANGITKGSVVSTAPASRNAKGFLDNYKLDLSQKVKAKVNSKLYKAGIGTPQNTDDETNNSEGF